MPRNAMNDLNNHLFEQLERLNDSELSDEDLKKEIERSKAMRDIATQIVNGKKITVDAMRLMYKGGLPESATKLLGTE